MEVMIQEAAPPHGFTRHSEIDLRQFKPGRAAVLSTSEAHEQGFTICWGVYPFCDG
jgi:hypothetical protein